MEEIKKRNLGDVLYVETGEKFRNFIKGEGYTNKKSLAVYERDELQPSFLAAHMWTSEIIEKFRGVEHLVLDGTPRTLDESSILTSAFSFYGIEKPAVLHLNVSREWSKNHLLARGRFDDANGEKIEKRLNWFESDVVPALEYFRENDFYRFFEINGEQTIEKVHADIMEQVSPILSQ